MFEQAQACSTDVVFIRLESRLHDTPLRHAARHVLAAGTRRSGLDFLRQRFTSVTCKRHLPQVDSSQVIARRQEREEGGPSPGFSDIK